MRYLSYMTDHCKQTAKKYSRSNEIEKLSLKVEEDQSVQAWDFFSSYPIYKERSWQKLSACLFTTSN